LHFSRCTKMPRVGYIICGLICLTRIDFLGSLDWHAAPCSFRSFAIRYPNHNSNSYGACLMKIPKIIHQTWKTDEIPYRWQAAVSSVKRYHPGWDYRLWTDQTMDDFVRIQRPDFYPVFKAFPYEIMRADSFRYCLMAEIGGLYCDLDYEFLRPYDYGDKQVVFSKERSTSYGDPADTVAITFSRQSRDTRFGTTSLMN
jgi:mannosyltransferase OCH1-like enzyme